MRKGLTLLELILSMVIIGIVFTVIPRLIISMNQAAQTTVKEEAMYNALALMGAIINLPWDENNTANDQILLINSLPIDNPNGVFYDCNTSSRYRIGGFIGSRNCRTTSTELNLTASSLGHDPLTSDDVNDIDDYDNNVTAPTFPCSDGTLKSLDYNITTSVYYVGDPSVAESVILSKTRTDPTTNTKYVAIKKGSCTLFEYHSFNIGQIDIKKRNDW